MKSHHFLFGKLGQNIGTVFSFHFEVELPSRVLICLTKHWIFMLN
jgi:hypothetical protein